MDWINLDQEMDKWQAVMKKRKELLHSIKCWGISAL